MVIKLNKVVHFEIPADDLARATNFYKSVFGWDTDKFGDDMYMAKTVKTDENSLPQEKGAINGDISKKKNNFMYPTIVLSVQNIDEKVKQVKAAGGKLVEEKRQVADMGLYARVADTEGNVIGLWQDLK